MEPYQIIERSIVKTYRKPIWRKFIKAINEYDLIQENDKIMVCISGGKDSFLLAKCMQELQRYSIVPFEARYVVMNPGYRDDHLTHIQKNAELLHLPIEIFTSHIFDVVDQTEKNPCYLCARMRRGFLYNQAQKLGCNKIALGHHFDDVIETTLLSMFYGSEAKTMMPKLHSDHFLNMELIRPLYMVKEESIIRWRDANHLTFLNCACHFTEKNTLEHIGESKRLEIKKLIQELKKTNDHVDLNIFTSMHNVNMGCIVGYKQNGEKHSFLEEYEKKGD